MKPIIIIGAGGHANVLLDILLAQGHRVHGLTDVNANLHGQLRQNIPILGNDSLIETYANSEISLVNAVGSTYVPHHRRQLFEKYQSLGYDFINVQHTSASCSQFAQLGQGCQVLAGSVIAAQAKIGDNVLLNHRSVVEHDCCIGAHCHIATGAVICGASYVEDSVHIGAGATLIQGVHIGTGTVVAAGATVINDIPAHVLVAGTPATIKKTLNN